jgi:hypothetical protein
MRSGKSSDVASWYLPLLFPSLPEAIDIENLSLLSRARCRAGARFLSTFDLHIFRPLRIGNLTDQTRSHRDWAISPSEYRLKLSASHRNLGE